MSKKSWIIFIVAVAVLLGGLVIWSRSNSSKTSVDGIDSSVILAASDASGSIADQVFGKTDSKVVLIEYGDYQCPGCGSLEPKIKKIVDEYQSKIAFVFRNFPLTDIHPNAKAAAAAVEAAGLQGKFWDVHEAVYAQQSSWSSLGINERLDFFKNLVSGLGLNTDQFTQDMGSDKVLKKLNFDKQLGVKAGVDSTPSLFIGKDKLDNSIIQNIQSGDGQKLRDLLDSKLQ
jgi:protein-disulfide isomerase